jgi:hypothetical protein
MHEARCVNVLFILLYDLPYVEAIEQNIRNQEVCRDLKTKVMRGSRTLKSAMARSIDRGLFGLGL